MSILYLWIGCMIVNLICIKWYNSQADLEAKAGQREYGIAIFAAPIMTAILIVICFLILIGLAMLTILEAIDNLRNNLRFK